MKQLSTRAEMQYNIHTLSNGLRIIHEPSSSKVAYCGFAVDAGTRDEAENEQGPHGECGWRSECVYQ